MALVSSDCYLGLALGARRMGYKPKLAEAFHELSMAVAYVANNIRQHGSRMGRFQSPSVYEPDGRRKAQAHSVTVPKCMKPFRISPSRDQANDLLCQHASE